MKPKIQTFLHELAGDFRWSQFNSMILLMILSSLFVFSATYMDDHVLPKAVKSQWMWFSIGLCLYILISMTDYHWICRHSWLIYSGVFVLLILVFRHKATFGAQRWIPIGSIKIQPSEFAKISVLLTLCHYLSRCMGQLSDWRRLAFVSAIALIPAVLINKQPDLGTALVVVALFLMLLFMAGAPMRFFAILGIITVLGGALIGFETYRYAKFRRAHSELSVPKEDFDENHPQKGVLKVDSKAERLKPTPPAKFKSYFHLKEYQLNRILGVVAPDELDRLREGWNREQALIAIGSGGLTGKGWTKGDVTRGGYLPRTISLNDFIFAVFAEETGLVGGVVLVSLYAILLFGGVRIAMRARDSLGMLLASGVTFLLFFHVFVNIGMTLGILPIVGVPLPLMSYGGSFVLVCMVALGLLHSVWLHRKPY